MDFVVRHDKGNQLFVTAADGKEAYLRYSLKGNDTIDFIYTYVPNELRGKGLAAVVVKEGFKYAEENNLKVIPTCPYVRTFLERHPEYQKFIK